MAYATHANLVEQYGNDFVVRSFDKDGNGTVDAAVETKALEDASDEIDSYLSVRYGLPLPTIPRALTRVCGDIAIYRGSGEAGTVTDEKRLRYEDAVKWLKDIAKGVASLGLSATDESPAIASGAVSVSYPNARLFTRGTMRRL